MTLTKKAEITSAGEDGEKRNLVNCWWEGSTSLVHNVPHKEYLNDDDDDMNISFHTVLAV